MADATFLRAAGGRRCVAYCLGALAGDWREMSEAARNVIDNVLSVPNGGHDMNNQNPEMLIKRIRESSGVRIAEKDLNAFGAHDFETFARENGFGFLCFDENEELIGLRLGRRPDYVEFFVPN